MLIYGGEVGRGKGDMRYCVEREDWWWLGADEVQQHKSRLASWVKDWRESKKPLAHARKLLLRTAYCSTLALIGAMWIIYIRIHTYGWICTHPWFDCLDETFITDVQQESMHMCTKSTRERGRGRRKGMVDGCSCQQLGSLARDLHNPDNNPGTRTCSAALDYLMP